MKALKTHGLSDVRHACLAFPTAPALLARENVPAPRPGKKMNAYIPLLSLFSMGTDRFRFLHRSPGHAGDAYPRLAVIDAT